MSDHGGNPGPILEEQLRLGSGFGADDRDHVLELLSALDRHLAHWNPDRVDLEISVKDRGGAEQKVTLEAWLPSWPALVATAADQEFDHALIGVRKDMIRQIDDEKSKREHKARTGRPEPA
jgi:ribosome-associated translation inhibitor RaiA